MSWTGLYLGIGVAILGLPGCFAKRPRCHLCSWVDSTDKGIRSSVEYYQWNYQDGCKFPVTDTHSDPNTGGFGTRNSLCVTIAGKYDGIPFVRRSAIGDYWKHAKDGKCDDANDYRGPCQGKETQMIACYCTTDWCNNIDLQPNTSVCCPRDRKRGLCSSCTLTPSVVALFIITITILFSVF